MRRVTVRNVTVFPLDVHVHRPTPRPVNLVLRIAAVVGSFRRARVGEKFCRVAIVVVVVRHHARPRLAPESRLREVHLTDVVSTSTGSFAGRFKMIMNIRYPVTSGRTHSHLDPYIGLSCQSNHVWQDSLQPRPIYRPILPIQSCLAGLTSI